MILEVDQSTLNRGGLMTGKLLPDMTEEELRKYTAELRDLEDALGCPRGEPRFFRLDQITL